MDLFKAQICAPKQNIHSRYSVSMGDISMIHRKGVSEWFKEFNNMLTGCSRLFG